MRKSTRIIIPIPKTRNTQCRVLIGSSDVTARVIKSSWIKPVTSGIGTFNIKLSNSFGQLNGLYNKGDTAIFYADNSDGTTQKFYGIIDFVKNDIGDTGQFLNIDGRHRGFHLNEFMVCHSATAKPTSQILKDIIDKLPANYGITYENVNTTTDLMDVEWNYKPFWDCVLELTNFSGYDAYVDDDLDIHFFEENSILNEDDAIVEGDNLLDSKEWGTNSLYEKTRVIVMGQDAEGLPIIHTAISENETEIKEVFIKDNSANTEQRVQDLANANLLEVINKNPQGIIKSFGLETTNPGDNIWIIIPRQQIAGQYKIIQITHKFGMAIGGWRTECLTEEEPGGTSKILRDMMKSTNVITEAENVNKFNYSYNFPYDEDTGTHSNTEITEGVLKTIGATGTWISPNRNLSENATKCEIKVSGDALTGTKYYISSDGGLSWQRVIPNTLTAMKTLSQVLQLKVNLNSASTQIKSLVLLYS